MIPWRVAFWLLVVAIQPLLIEGFYQLFAWYWYDPLFVRFCSLTGAFLMLCILTTFCFSSYRIIKGERVDGEEENEDINIFRICMYFIGLTIWVLPILPWIGIQYNWIYRPVGFLLQLQIVVMWICVCLCERSVYLAEWAAKLVGLVMAGCVGLRAYIFSQFVNPETPFWGTVANYDPVTETTSAANVATGDPWFSVKLMGFSLLLTFVLYLWQLYRSCRGHHRGGSLSNVNRIP
jgi:hypothetical protein